MTAHCSGVKARRQNTSTSQVCCSPCKRWHQRTPGWSRTACAGQAHPARGSPAAEHTSQPHWPSWGGGGVHFASPRSVTHRGRGHVQRLLPPVHGGTGPATASFPAVRPCRKARRKRGAIATVLVRADGRARPAAMLGRSGEVMGARPGVVWWRRSAPGRGFPGLG